MPSRRLLDPGDRDSFRARSRVNRAASQADPPILSYAKRLSSEIMMEDAKTGALADASQRADLEVQWSRPLHRCFTRRCNLETRRMLIPLAARTPPRVEERDTAAIIIVRA